MLLCRLLVTRLLLLVDHEIHTLPGHLSSSRFYWGWCCSNFSFLHNIFSTIACLFVHFLYYCPRITASDYSVWYHEAFFFCIYNCTTHAEINVDYLLFSLRRV